LKESFDILTSFGVVEHFTDTAHCLEACSRFLRPGGVMMTVIPNLAGLNGAGTRFFSPETYAIHVPMSAKALRQAHEKAGLEVLECRYFTPFWISDWSVPAQDKRPHRRLLRNLLWYPSAAAAAATWVVDDLIGNRIPAADCCRPGRSAGHASHRPSLRTALLVADWIGEGRRLHAINIASLYISLALNAAISLLLIGYLARVLLPEAWGAVLLAQALGLWLSLVPDYGFTLSAGRSVAQAKSPAEVAQISYSVMGARLLLATALLPLAAAAYFIFDVFQAEPLLLIGALVYAFAQGLDPIWLFQGLERQYLYAAVSSVARLIGVALMILLVQGPGDAWIAMFVHALISGLTVVAGIFYLARNYSRPQVRMANVMGMLRTGWHVFLFRAAQSITGTGLLILGVVAPRAVEAFGSADRIVRLSVGLLGPISAAGMPRISRLVANDMAAAQRVARLSFFVMSGLGWWGERCFSCWLRWSSASSWGPNMDSWCPFFRSLRS
jgi:PST family polysaccharide transporter